jgi:hypothetical protein
MEDPVEIDAFLADAVEKAGGKLSALGAGWDQLSAQSFPARHPRVSMGVLLTLPYVDPAPQHDLDVHLEDADGNVLPLGRPAGAGGGQTAQRIRVQVPATRPQGLAPGDERTVSLALNLDGLVFQQPGRYRFVLSMDGTVVKHLGFRVVQQTPR